MRALTTLAALAAVAAAPSPAWAGATVVTGGVRGGQITGFSWDPTHATTVWAGVLGAGLFKSTNGGAAWTQILLPTIARHFANQVLASKAAADLVFVCETVPSTAAIWRSGDAAASFAGVLPTTTGQCTSIADGAASGTLWAGLQDASDAGHIYKSIDAGKTWTAAGLSVPGMMPSAIVQLPSGRLVVGVRAGKSGYKNGNTGGIYYSDNGISFTAATGAPAAAVFGIAFNGTSTLVALASDGATATPYTSSDGATWTAGSGVAGGDQGGQVSYHAGSDSFFLMATNNKLLESTNAAGGYSFASAIDRAASASTPVAYSVTQHAAFAVDPADANHLLLGDYGGGEGILASADGGGVWVVSNDGLFAQIVDFAFKTPSGYRYAANHTGFVYFGAASLTAPWLRVYRANDESRDPVVAMAYDTANDKRLVIAQANFVDQALLRALPDATAVGEDMAPFAHSAWQTLTYPDAAKNPTLALLVDGMTLFAGVSTKQSGTVGQYLYKSTNGGTSWAATSLAVAGGVRALAFDPSSHATLYAGAGDWKDNRVSVTHAGGLWKSTDGGDNWTRISTGDATLDGEAPRTIVVDPADGKRVWVYADRVGTTTGTDGDIFESLDGGATWTRITPSGSILAFTYSPAEKLLAYATGGANVNVYVKQPGTGSGAWDPGFGVYGEASVLYAGSVGVGTGSGLYEASGVMDVAPDLGAGGDDGGVEPDLAIVTPPGGGPMTMDQGGCGCGLVPATGAGAWGALLLLLAVRLLFRRRAGRARPRA